MKKTALVVLIVYFISASLMNCRAGDPDTTKTYRDYPVPEWNAKLMFYLQRTHNRNTVIYELNYSKGNRLDPDKPLRPIWIRFEEGGIRKELSLIQDRVFGLDVKQTSKDSWVVRFRSYKKRDVFIMRDGGRNSYKALVKINGKMVKLTHLYLSMTTNVLGIPSVISYIDIYGIDTETRSTVIERIIP